MGLLSSAGPIYEQPLGLDCRQESLMTGGVMGMRGQHKPPGGPWAYITRADLIDVVMGRDGQHRP